MSREDYSPIYSDEEVSENDKKLIEPIASNNGDSKKCAQIIVETTPGRQKLRTWLTKIFRVAMTDGRVLIGEFLCTDADANVILGMCSEYTQNNQKLENERFLGSVMVPGRHIVSMEVDLCGHKTSKTVYPVAKA